VSKGHEVDHVSASRATVVVPCFNEERRLQPEGLLQLLADPSVDLTLVDDGSSDGTLSKLEEIRQRQPTRVNVVALTRNSGKAEAVRAGMKDALSRGSAIICYLDADLATPPGEMLELIKHLEHGPFDVVLGARVALLGRHIERQPVRHYLGRVFATLASLSLDLRVYDTQCGAKAFRATKELAAALEAPFSSRWVFDVELLGRLLTAGVAPERFAEVPLKEWRDVKGSNLKPTAMARSFGELAAIGVRLRLGGKSKS
jgi:glycosyltransferase involved in cell wall biosynthesis